jgi:hypothetical protein
LTIGLLLGWDWLGKKIPGPAAGDGIERKRSRRSGSWNNLDADFGSWMLDFASLDCTAWIQSRLQAMAISLASRGGRRLHDFDRKLTNCMEHDVLPIVLLYIDVYKVPLAEAHSNIMC